MEPSKSGWRTSQVLVASVSLTTMSLILLLAGEGSRPLLLVSTPETKISTFNSYFGDKEYTRAVLAAREQDDYGMGQKRWREVHDMRSADNSYALEEFLSGVNASKLEEAAQVPSARPGDIVIGREEFPGAGVELEAAAGTTSESTKAKKAMNTGQCDFTQGFWVRDDSRPLYNGSNCKPYLSWMWACRRMKRTDFEYEKVRWQPKGCDLPTFSSEGFLRRMRNKVVAFVGDSLGRQQFQSLMCMLTAGRDDADVTNAAPDWSFDPPRGQPRGKGYVYRFASTNTTVLFYWTATLSLLEPAPWPDGRAALHLDRPDQFLRDSLGLLDLVVVNSGHHWNRAKFEANKWRMFVGGEALPEGQGLGQAYNVTMFRVAQFLDSKVREAAAEGRRGPAVFMRTLSPRHFTDGDWDTGGTCESTRTVVGRRASYKGPRVVEEAVRGRPSIRLLNIGPMSGSRDEAHISRFGGSGQHDCLHWCLPGVPDTWNELLYAYLATDSTF